MNITGLLAFAVKNNSSDLHLSAGMPPIIRVDGDLQTINLPELSHDDVRQMVFAVMNDQQREAFDTHLETDFCCQLADVTRFRVNVFTQARGMAAVFRTIPAAVKSMCDLGLPAVLADIASLDRGLVLVTGPAGSGKSTTLAAMVDHINNTQRSHIVTIEDPIEFVHNSKQSLINQREVHRDTHSFNAALRSALREDPDIILVGELRDPETIRLAMTAAETGHLVLATLHTSSATKTINRVIDVFPGDEKSMIRSMLSESLQAVIAQTLLKKTGGGRLAAVEIMICNPALRNLIREDKVAQMYSTIQTGQSQGMQTLDQHLSQLVAQNLITRETAREAALNKSMY